ncbi:hypothetical protein PBRA_007452 [Plasmodiophora brassicae]|nr:hypothetical protein PBRA_007452 [Plasmodiophora brassicae]
MKEDLNQFVVHAALDIVDRKLWTTPSLYLKQVDRFNDLQISVYVTASHVKFMLLHDPRCDEASIGVFFNDLYDLYLKIALNPFHQRTSPITSPAFADNVRALADRTLPKL